MDLNDILFAFLIRFSTVNLHNHMKINSTCISITVNTTSKTETYGK